jgi:hypothetical protein
MKKLLIIFLVVFAVSLSAIDDGEYYVYSSTKKIAEVFLNDGVIYELGSRDIFPDKPNFEVDEENDLFLYQPSAYKTYTFRIEYIEDGFLLFGSNEYYNEKMNSYNNNGKTSTMSPSMVYSAYAPLFVFVKQLD